MWLKPAFGGLGWSTVASQARKTKWPALLSQVSGLTLGVAAGAAGGPAAAPQRCRRSQGGTLSRVQPRKRAGDGRVRCSSASTTIVPARPQGALQAPTRSHVQSWLPNTHRGRALVRSPSLPSKERPTAMLVTGRASKRAQ